MEKEPTDATRHGLWREDVPELVEKILAASQKYEIEITVRPEGVPEGYEYVVEWEFLEYDREDREWKPLQELETSENL